MCWAEITDEGQQYIGQIEKAGLDGNNRQVIVHNIGSANGLSIDFVSDR